MPFRAISTLPLGLKCVLMVLTGAVFSYALAPYYHWYLAILSPALLYLALNHSTPKQALLLGWCYGFGLWFVGAFWLFTSIHVYGGIPVAIATLMVAMMAMVMAIFSAVQAYVYQRFFAHSPLAFSAIWVIFEWLKTWVFTGFPWLFVGYAFTETWLDSYAPIVGVLGVSWVAVWLATSGIELLKRQYRHGWVIVFLLSGAWVSGQFSFVHQKSDEPLSVSLIQGNIQQHLKWSEDHFISSLQTYVNLSASEWGRDLIVWPESAIANYQTTMRDFLTQVSQEAKAHSSAWITGIIFKDEMTGKSFNSVMALGESQGEYHKQRLVPFGEYIPLSGLLYWVLPQMQQDIANGSYSIGNPSQSAISVKGHELATAICYEVAYPDLTRKNAQQSEFLLTVSNDAWFVGTAGPWQHLQMVQMRAIENGRWFIRATNTGVTAIINPQGKVMQTAPQDIATVVRGNVPLMSGQTPYTRWGDSLILLLSLLGLGVVWRRKIKQ